jgi:transposase
MPLSPDGIAMCQTRGVEAQAEGEGIHGRSYHHRHRSGKERVPGSRRCGGRVVVFRKKLSRPQFARFMADHPPCVVAMEACASAHHWAREMARHGHEVRLIAPHYVKPFIKRQKNDAADAEAIVEAALRPTMRFVEPKTADQQARAVAFRTREQLVKQRTEAVNALRSHLYEFGHVAPEGIGYLPRLAKVIEILTPAFLIWRAISAACSSSRSPS